MKSHNVKLDAATVEKAREIGAGNLSEGLRVAVDNYAKLSEENASLKRGEFICQRCGIRKDSEHGEVCDF